MSQESADPRRETGRTDEEIERLRERTERLEEAVSVFADRNGWTVMRSLCTHCQQGRLVRNGMTVRCTVCRYQSK